MRPHTDSHGLHTMGPCQVTISKSVTLSTLAAAQQGKSIVQIVAVRARLLTYSCRNFNPNILLQEPTAVNDQRRGCHQHIETLCWGWVNGEVGKPGWGLEDFKAHVHSRQGACRIMHGDMPCSYDWGHWNADRRDMDLGQTDETA